MDQFIVKKIKALKKIKPDTSWLSSQRSFLLSEISRPKISEKKLSFAFPVFKVFRPAFAIALVIVVLISSLGTIGIISAAQNSLPGDFLYPLKTAFEQTQLTFTAGEANKTKFSIKLATHRMDEFTQLIDKPDKKEDVKKAVQKFTAQMINIQQGIDKLKEKNAEKAAEVAKLVKAQTSIYEETLIKGSENIAYIIPEDKEDIKKDIDQALKENNRAAEISKELIPEPAGSLKDIQVGEQEIFVPIENAEGVIESGSDKNSQE